MPVNASYHLFYNNPGIFIISHIHRKVPTFLEVSILGFTSLIVSENLAISQVKDLSMFFPITMNPRRSQSSEK